MALELFVERIRHPSLGTHNPDFEPAECVVVDTTQIHAGLWCHARECLSLLNGALQRVPIKRIAVPWLYTPSPHGFGGFRCQRFCYQTCTFLCGLAFATQDISQARTDWIWGASRSACALLGVDATSDGEARELVAHSLALDGVGLARRVDLSRYIAHHASKLRAQPLLLPHGRFIRLACA